MNEYYPDKQALKVLERIQAFFKKHTSILSRIGIFIVFSALALVPVVVGNVIYDGIFGWTTVEYGDDNEGGYVDSGECTVFAINLHGTLYTYIPVDPETDEYSYEFIDSTSSEDIIGILEQAKEDDAIKAVILEVDSYGGSPVAGEEIAAHIARVGLEKPTVAFIRQSGLSAAYWAVSGVDKLFASKNSDVGSIGVTASYLETINKDSRYVDLSSGKFKDVGDPDRPITEEEKNVILRDVKIIHQNFIEAVAENRALDIKEVEKIADGSSVLGAQAKDLGLVDEIGGYAQALDYLESTLGEEPVICWQ